MPLTLECVCADNEDVAACELVELWWEGTSRYSSLGGINVGNSITLMNGVSAVTGLVDTGDGEWSEALSLGLVGDWESLFVRFAIDTSLNQEAVPGGAAIYELAWWIRAVYECPGGERFEVLLREQTGEDAYCWVVEDVTARSYVHTGHGAGVGILYSSHSLADCNGTSADSGAFDPLPSTTLSVGLSVPGSVCLCPVGGTPPYYFAAISPLPEGLTLDTDTGCIGGTQTDAGGTRELTFQVADSNRDTATVTCTFLSACGGSEVQNFFL